MNMWVDRLVSEYEAGRKELTRKKDKLNAEFIYDREDKKHITSMINDMSESIKWMKTERQPGLYRGVDKKNAYRKKQYDEMDIIPDITEQLEREPLYMDQEQRQALIRLFTSFSYRERQCYVMYEAEQLSMKKIAEILGIKKRTVQQYIERARKKVEKIAS